MGHAFRFQSKRLSVIIRLKGLQAKPKKGGTMQLKMGSAVVSTALVGVPPTSRLKSP